MLETVFIPEPTKPKKNINKREKKDLKKNYLKIIQILSVALNSLGQPHIRFTRRSGTSTGSDYATF